MSDLIIISELVVKNAKGKAVANKQINASTHQMMFSFKFNH